MRIWCTLELSERHWWQSFGLLGPRWHRGGGHPLFKKIFHRISAISKTDFVSGWGDASPQFPPWLRRWMIFCDANVIGKLSREFTQFMWWIQNITEWDPTLGPSLSTWTKNLPKKFLPSTLSIASKEVSSICNAPHVETGTNYRNGWSQLVSGVSLRKVK